MPKKNSRVHLGRGGKTRLFTRLRTGRCREGLIRRHKMRLAKKRPRKHVKKHRLVFRKWRVVNRVSERHPHVEIREDSIGGKRKIVCAKLHSVKENESRTDVSYFSRSPNPRKSKNRGAFYKKLSNVSPEALRYSDGYHDWHVPADGRRKMNQRSMETKGNREREAKRRLDKRSRN